MSRWLLVLPLVVLVATPTSAWALKPSKHRELAETACRAEGLPDAFCRRMGKATYETDYTEWDDLAAHAQRELDQDRCAAADAAITRVDGLARSVVALTRSGSYEQAAVSLGAALHTIQDECAHHGMTNQEHAFHSLSTQCTDVDTSPDTQPAALACADQRTKAVMHQVASVLNGTRWGFLGDLCEDTTGDHPRDTCSNAVMPTLVMACDFLAEHKNWDGDDSSWDQALVGDALVAAVSAALHGEPATRTACGGNPAAIDPPSPRAPIIDQTRAVSCFMTDLACLGKVDADDAEAELASAGCRAGGPSTSLAAFALLGLLPRRRRRR